MSTSSVNAEMHTFPDQLNKCGFLRAGRRVARPLRAVSTAGLASLAAAALVLVAPGGGATMASGPVSASLWRTTSPRDGAVTRVSRGLELDGGFGVSPNWAGYVIQPGQDVDYVSGVWTVPALGCDQTPYARDSVWAGIGGDGTGTGDLLQTGVADECSNGLQQDQAWWELYPENEQINFTGLPVSPGDVMEASVYLDSSSGQWVTRLDNLTTGMSGWMVDGGTYGIEPDGSGSLTVEGSRSISYAGGSTVEWVLERPTPVTGAALPLPDFGTVQFSELRAGLQSWSLNPGEGLAISYNNQIVAQPSPPGEDGFSVSYAG
jgi:hypothetical protein